MDDTVRALASEGAANLETLEQAFSRTEKALAEFKAGLLAALPLNEAQQIDVVLTGSFARREITYESDCDFLVVVDQTVDPIVVAQMVREMDQLRQESEFGKPGTQGIFGDFVTANELLQRIGSDGDSNANLTRRMLLLNESVSVYRPELRARIIRQILERYCLDYHPKHGRASEDVHVPRFLLNDVVRYWRTIAVDFGAKQWKSLSTNWFLRYAKLLTTRKILFAGVLGSLLATKLVLRPGASAHDQLLDYLAAECDRTPLERLASMEGLVSSDGRRALVRVVESYAQFIEILDRRNTRTILARPDFRADSKEERLRSEIEQLGECIQEGLEGIFFGDEHIRPLTQRYGLF